jgi:hypothetical protein
MTEAEMIRHLAERGYLVKRARSPLTRDLPEITRRYEAGESVRAIGASYGMHGAGVAQVLRRAGVAMRPRGARGQQAVEQGARS